METTFMNTISRNTIQPHKFVLNFSQRLGLTRKMLLFKTYLFIARGKI